MSQSSDLVKTSKYNYITAAADAPRRAELLAAELHKAQTQLQEERLRHQALLRSLGEGLIVIDQDGLITDVNPHAVRILGFSEADMVGQWFPKVIQAVSEDGEVIEPLNRPITRALSLGTAVSDISYYIKAGGAVIPVAITVAPVMLGDKPIGAIEIFRDVTQERALDKAKDDFVSLASHQLRTPATAVKAILSMMHAGDFGELTARQTHFLAKALETNDRQLDIIEDMLNAARIDSGKLTLSPMPVDVAGLTHQAVQEHLADLAKRRLTITVDRPAESLIATADPAKLRMVLDNLISNAAKYTPQGGRIRVQVEIEYPVLRIAVSDTGVGIAEADRHRLFRKFSRVENELTAEVSGSGLGLYLAKHIVDLHGGSIEVESEPGSGSTFTIALPLEAATEKVGSLTSTISGD